MNLDLGSAPFLPADECVSPPELGLPELGLDVLLASVGARQAASATARTQAALAAAAADRDPLFRPAEGAFNANQARVMAAWKGR